MSNLENTDIINWVPLRIFRWCIAAVGIATLLPACAGPQLPPESTSSSPASVEAPETPPNIATVSLNDDTTRSIAARLQEANTPQSRTGHPVHSGDSSSPPASKSEPANATYTCPMHPQIKQGQPGECSICGMDLVPI